MTFLALGRRFLSVALPAAMLIACTLLPDRRDIDPVTVFPMEQRQAAPGIIAETIDGQQLALADLDGPVVGQLLGLLVRPLSCRSIVLVIDTAPLGC